MRCHASLPVGVVLFAVVAATAQASDIIVDEFIDIPTLKEEVISARPSGVEVWIPGYWERDPGKWTWSDGHWDTPPHKKAHWENGEWKWRDDKWHWRRGHWAVDDTLWIVDQVVDVPNAFSEQKPPKPTDKNHWIAGHWDWDDGGWFWIPGYYTKKPHPNAAWVPGRWEPYGNRDGFWWMGGHWRVS